MIVPPEFLFCFIQTCLDKDNERYKMEREMAKQTVYYFAYGATMCQELFEYKVGKVEFVSKAALKDFRLHFSKINPHVPAMATLVPEEGSDVEGVIYKITREQLRTLDHWKTSSFLNQRITLAIRKDPSNPEPTLSAEVYIANRELPYHPPKLQYMQLMVAGAEKIGVSDFYKRQLLKHAFAAATSRSKL